MFISHTTAVIVHASKDLINNWLVTSSSTRAVILYGHVKFACGLPSPPPMVTLTLTIKHLQSVNFRKGKNLNRDT